MDKVTLYLNKQEELVLENSLLEAAKLFDEYMARPYYDLFKRVKEANKDYYGEFKAVGGDIDCLKFALSKTDSGIDNPEISQRIKDRIDGMAVSSKQMKDPNKADNDNKLKKPKDMER